jgi:prepilin-type N-terminal cleavage/methylation domain-containing protein
MGFTLIELMAVLSILSVMMGIGLGFLGRGSTDFELAQSIVRDHVRLAALTAQSRGAPTDVLLLRQEGRVPQMRARVLSPVGAWHFERDERWLSDQLEPELGGEREPAGRFGAAMRPDAAAKRPVLKVVAGDKPLFDLRQGFALRLELRCETRAPCVVAELGRALVLACDGDLVPELRVTLADPGRRQGPTRTARGQRGLPVGRWVTVDAIHDGQHARILVDGVAEAEIDARGEPYRTGGDAFVVSPANSAVPGLIDEVQLFAYELSEIVDLPDGAVIKGFDGDVLRFNARGEPEHQPTILIQVGDESVERRVAPGGILQ